MALVSAAACVGASAERGGAERESTPPSLLPAASAPAASSAPQRGKLAPPPTTLALGQFWPTRICTRGSGVIVVANSCACDSKMTCSITRRGKALDLHVGMTQELCKDCGTFLATCAVPADARPRGATTRTFRITVDGKPVLDALELPRGDAPAIERCYE